MDLSRRDALKIGGFGVVGSGLVAMLGAPASPVNVLDGLLDVAPAAAAAGPGEIVSVDGILRGQLTITDAPVLIAGETTSGALTYNGRYPGPVLRMRPGDRILLDVTNESTLPVNTHFHGFHVTPEGSGDNVFAMVLQGETFHHDFVIPLDHPGGLYWYHPHDHGSVNEGIYRGLSGLIVVAGGAADLPELADRTHRLMALKNTTITGTGPGRILAPEPSPDITSEIHTINGELLPAYEIAPGETQLWQLGSIGNDNYYRLVLDGHAFTVVGEDGALLWDTYTTEELVIPPGKRFEVAVTGGPPGTYALRTLGYDQGPFLNWPPVDLATVTVTGTPATPAAIPAHPAPRHDLADQPIANHRVIVFNEGFDSATGDQLFFINGVLYQNITPSEILQLTLGTTEEWVIRNDPSLPAGGTAEDHVFHIHINDMVQTGRGTWDPATGGVTSYEAVTAHGTIDTFNVKPNEYVVVRMQFTDFTGRSVFHCHITQHEDGGMMGIIQLDDPAPIPIEPEPVEPALPVAVVPSFTG